MHVAAKWGQLPMIQLLLQKEAIINIQTRDGLTPLHCAARSGYVRVVDYLLENHADHSSKTRVSIIQRYVALYLKEQMINSFHQNSYDFPNCFENRNYHIAKQIFYVFIRDAMHTSYVSQFPFIFHCEREQSI